MKYQFCSEAEVRAMAANQEFHGYLVQCHEINLSKA